MRLISLQLCNFRQFYGKTPPIIFSSGDRNTTIIYGNNGSGKTTILNAFTWVLYENFTAAFAIPELLINKRAIIEADIDRGVECWVEIQFERDGKRYQLKRKCFATRNQENITKYSKSKLFILVSADDGKWYPPVESADDIIEQILPVSLHQYFFFDGERIDNFFRRGVNNNIAEDTKELLGVKVLDRSIEHLKRAKKILQEELATIGDPQTKQLWNKYNKLESSIKQSQDSIQDLIKQVTKFESYQKNLASELLELRGASELQNLKEKLIKEEKTVRNNLLKAKKELKQLISRQGYLVFISAINNKFLTFVDRLRETKQLSTGIKAEFIEQLLAQQVCICGSQLIPETANYESVKKLLATASSQDIEQGIINLETKVRSTVKLLEDFWQNLDRQQAYINQQYQAITRIEQELEKINYKLRSYPNKDIRKLQQDMESVELKIKEFILEQGITQQQITTQEQELSIVTKEIDKHKLKEEAQILTNKRINSAQEAITRLIEVRSRLEKQFRIALEQKVQEIFSSISFTPYIPKLDNNYELTLVEKTSGVPVPVAASTGENQILSLSFIGGIINRVREWSQKNTLMGPDSSTFPMVMDSPFGSLDEIYRRQVAKAIPQLANQLVVLVTKTQWRGEVEKEIKKHIGKEYVLVYNSPKKNCLEDSIQIDGVNYFLVKQSVDRFEYTELIEVKH